MMILERGRIEMTAREFEAFAAATFAPWQPRTIGEFNAMCRLGYERHLVDNTGGAGFIPALACEGMMFNEDGTPNFPMDPRKEAYMRQHGTWPTDAQLREFLEATGADKGSPTLQLVKG